MKGGEDTIAALTVSIEGEHGLACICTQLCQTEMVSVTARKEEEASEMMQK